MATLLDDDKQRVSRQRPGRRELIRVRVIGNRATARVTFSSNVDGQLTFSNERGGWKLDDLVLQPQWATKWTNTESDLGFNAWRITGGERRPCPTSSGGCPAELKSAPVDLLLLTAFGDFSVAHCRFGYRLHVGDPVYLADRVRFSGAGICKRIAHCKDGETGLRYPWLGNGTATAAPNVVKNYFDVCVNTPVGRVRGFLYTRLVHKAGDWRASTYDYPIGPSGFQIVGAWDIAPDSFGIGHARPGS